MSYRPHMTCLLSEIVEVEFVLLDSKFNEVLITTVFSEYQTVCSMLQLPGEINTVVKQTACLGVLKLQSRYKGNR